MTRKWPDRVDVLVVGAGPAGLSAARHLRAAGATVLLVDARAHIGYPPRCAELARGNFFEVFGFDHPPEWVRRRLRGLRNMPVLNRTATESGAAAILGRMGVTVVENCALVGLGAYDGRERPATFRYQGEAPQTRAQLVIAADGAASRVARLAGIDTRINPLETVACLAYRVVDCDLADADDIRFEYPPILNPHYFWVVPSGPREANIGLGLPMHRGHAARPILERLMAQTDSFSGGRIAQTLVGWYPSTLPLEVPYTDGLLVAGTAARFIDAELGEGIWQGAFSGRQAAEAYLRTAGRGTTAADLAPYRQLLEPMYRQLYDGYHKRRLREMRQAHG